MISRLVQIETGQSEAVDNLLVLFDGAVAASTYRGLDAIYAARSAAATLVKKTTP
ncbi:MAG: hypothetical protein AAFU80_24745 [Pseudomonadota bacterium]